LRTGNYDECIASFRNVINAYPGHAFAHYCLAKAYEEKGELGLAQENKKTFCDIINNNPYWQDWATYFDLK
jgi:tetratricopeptide (TPR) repeat protein